jgi:hypothetical protein
MATPAQAPGPYGSMGRHGAQDAARGLVAKELALRTTRVRSTIGMKRNSTTLRIERRDGERLILDGLGLARGFFLGDPSSIAVGSYDSLAGRGERDRITTADIQAINRTMRARSAHESWRAVLDGELSWLAAIDPKLDLIGAGEANWRAAEGERLVTTALTETIGHGRGPSVATKVLHLKRPRLFPLLDDFVAVMLGVNMPTDPTPRRVEIAAGLVVHLRAQGRANIQQLKEIRAALGREGLDRPLVRILDAILWFAHPAAGVPNATRELAVSVSRIDAA